MTADPSVCDYVGTHGGTVWVRPTRRRCCGGSLTLLDASTERPEDAANYEPLDDAALPMAVRFEASQGRPDELVLELRGLARKHLAAFWDGCAFKP